jgi:hypothetical protein
MTRDNDAPCFSSDFDSHDKRNDAPCFSSDFSVGSVSTLRYSSSPEDCTPSVSIASEAHVANNDPY